MPRPGPRPYECVRRAWHSDRHHPIRGSLIQDIFRIVNEVHSSATRKNREWQEKLPIVVLKAEEIMYSKANSEAEYSDLKTLWDRINDAINTIIRRDESTETGELLQPCIEAALHLGCSPRRLSRSQRNDYCPKYYLSRPEMPVSTSITKEVYANQTTNNSPLMLHYSQYSSNQNRINYSDKKPKNYAFSDHHPSVQTYAWSAYPLYYNDNQIQSDDPKLYSTKPSTSYSHQINPSLTPSIGGEEIKCDLTLRLGSIVVPCGINENSWPLQVKNRNSSILEERKFKSHLNK